MTEAKQLEFQAEVSQVLRLVINSLYTSREIFLRELVSNASDALDRLRFQLVQNPELVSGSPELKIRILPDPATNTLTLWDNGDGMSEEALAKNLGTVAWSGSREFFKQLEAAKSADAGMRLIGQFGVGFYSSFLVADRVEVVSRAASESGAHRWISTGEQHFTLEPAERDVHGTSVILHLKEDAKEFLEPWRLKSLIERYSDFVGHSIELVTPAKPAEGDTAAEEAKNEVVNQARALWQRQPKEVSEEQYEEFYKHLAHDWEKPLGQRHFHIEGTQMFSGLLFIPRTRRFEMFDDDTKHGVRLHVRRVLVMENSEELVPRWLRFVKGVVDSEDLPLNVSRETLQDSRAVRIIKKQIVSQVLELLGEIAKDRPEDYAKFWENFGEVLKEGLHFDPAESDRLLPLLRFAATGAEAPSSLADYVGRMKEEQEAIYYATGLSRAVLEQGPHLEGLRRRGFEVLLLTDPVDPFVVTSIGEFEGKKLVNVTDADMPALSDEAGGDDAPSDPAASGPIIERFKRVLGDRIAEVRPSRRLTDSPACLVTPEGGVPPHVEMMMRARRLDMPPAKRILELNLGHQLLKSLASLSESSDPSEQLDEWVEVVFDQARLAEGTPIENPAKFAQRVSAVLTLAATAEAAKGPAAPADAPPADAPAADAPAADAPAEG